MISEKQREYNFRYYKKKKAEGTWKVSYVPVSEEQKKQSRQEASSRYKDWLKTEDGQTYLEKYNKSKRKYSSVNERQAQQRIRDREREETDLDYVLQRRLAGIKHRCKKEDLPFNLDHTYLKSIYTGFCPYLNVELVLRKSQDKNGNNLSVDKIIPELGYIKGNVQIISNKANLMKANATLDELKLFATNILKIHGGL